MNIDSVTQISNQKQHIHPKDNKMSIISTIQLNITGPWFILSNKHLIKCIFFSGILLILFVLQLYLNVWIWYMSQWTRIVSSRRYYHIIGRVKKFKEMIDIWINQFIIWTVLREDIQIIYQGEKIKTDEKRQVIISNHRSLLDYTMIQSHFGAENLVFANWGRIMKYPSLQHFWTIFRHDENHSISTSKFKRFNGPESIVIFPEVNIFTPEIKMIERKLMKMRYKGLPVLHNVLYPRFGTFVNVIQAMSNNANNKWCQMFEQLILPATQPSLTHHTNLVDLTLIYYTISLTNDDRYKLEQTTPSLWDVWSLETPMILCIHAQNYDLEKLAWYKES